jgi:triosephosphate isomerase
LKVIGAGKRKKMFLGDKPMRYIFVNLKRFDVPKKWGGICPVDDPQAWIESVMEQSVALGLGQLAGIRLVYLLPEALLLPARRVLAQFPANQTAGIQVGAQSVFRDDVQPGGNFGAFTSNLPPTAARNLGCAWSMIGHSEERRDKLGLLQKFEPAIAADAALNLRAQTAVDETINQAVLGALAAGLDVVLCVGETAPERGDGNFAEQRPRIEAVLQRQLALGLKGVEPHLAQRNIVIGYEPVWAIGPGKTPPGAEYIGFVSRYLKTAAKELYGVELPVVYGGGLKEENAGMIAHIETINGGLVALTRFSGDIGFDPADLKKIIAKYQE